MPNTDESINESGIPQLTMEVSPSQEIQWPVDATLSISEEAADAKAVGDALADIESAISDINIDISGIKDWTASDLPMTSETGSDSVADAISDITEDVSAIQNWTGENIPLDSSTGSIKISELLASLYPIGAIYSSTAETMPSILTAMGTWVKVRIPLTWGDVRNGTRSFEEIPVDSTVEDGTLRYWMRTE